MIIVLFTYYSQLQWIMVFSPLTALPLAIGIKSSDWLGRSESLSNEKHCSTPRCVAHLRPDQL